MQYQYKGNVTPLKARKILEKHGLKVDESKVEEVLRLLYRFANIAVQQLKHQSMENFKLKTNERPL